MPVVFALEDLYNKATTRLNAEGTLPTAKSLFGWRKSAQLHDPPAIVWIPGDPNGALGAIGGPKRPARLPNRPIANLDELFTVEISAVDTSALEDEFAQYYQARLLFDAWVRAVYLDAHGTFAIRSAGWVTNTLERRYGATIRVVATIEAAIFDSAVTLAPVDTEALITPEMLDQTDPSFTQGPE